MFYLAQVDEAIGHKIFNARFVDEVRHVGTLKAKLKSRLIVQAYKDRDQGLLTYTTTIQDASQRLIMNIAADDLEELIMILWDIVQAYTNPRGNEVLSLRMTSRNSQLRTGDTVES